MSRRSESTESGRGWGSTPGAGDWVFLVLSGLALAQAAWVGTSLRVPDLALHYPFPGGDGLDWISNGLALSGEAVRYTGRPPLFALVIALLERLDATSLLPFLQQLLLAAVALAAYASIRRRRGTLIAAAVALCVLANELLLRQALDVMAEPLAAALLAGACATFIGARDDPRRYPAAGGLAGLAVLAQPVTGFFLPAAAATLLWKRRSHLRRPEPWIGAVLLLAPATVWVALKALTVGAAGHHGGRAWSLLRLKTTGIPFYFEAAVAEVGWPVLALIALAVARAAIRRFSERGTGRVAAGEPRLDDASIFTGVLALLLLLFFVFLYDFHGERFLLYPLVPALWWLGEGLATLRPTLLRALAAGLAVLFAAWPTPDFEAHPWREVARFAREDHAFEVIPVDLFPDAPSVVYLERRGADEIRWRPVYRLGNALRRRVKVAPATLYPRDWWGWRCLDGDFEVDEYVLARWACPGAPTRAVLAWSRAEPPAIARRARTERASAGESIAAAPFPATEAETWERARRVASEVGHPDGFLVAFASDGPPASFLRALPFVAGTSSLFIVPHAATARIRGELDAGPPLARWESAGCELRTTRLRSYEMLLIDSCAGR